MKTLLLLFGIFLSSFLSAASFYSLDGIKTVHLITEINSKDISKKYADSMMQQLKEMSDELDLKTKKDFHRSLAAILNVIYIDNVKIANIRLLIGEQVKREGIVMEHFAITYLDQEFFLLNNNIELDEKIEDALDTLLSRFTEQYHEENKKISSISIKRENFADAMDYETNYNTALQRAKVEHKDVMLILVAKFCPWCRKFEQRVLLDKNIDKLIHKNYIPLIINREMGNYPKNLDRSFTPIVHFIDYKTSKSYAHVIGYNNKEEFIHLLQR